LKQIEEKVKISVYFLFLIFKYVVPKKKIKPIMINPGASSISPITTKAPPIKVRILLKNV